MKRWLLILSIVALPTTVLLADEVEHGEETVPSTVHGGGTRIKRGGKGIGSGFQGIGRGVKKMFTGERSKDEFKTGGKELGDGFKDLGTGTAGVGRGVGNDVKGAVTGGEHDSADRQPEK